MSSLSRRRALTGLGLTSASAALLTSSTGASAAALDGPLPVMPVDTQDVTEFLRTNPRVQLVPGATYVLTSTAQLPDGCLIVGNGATVTTASTGFGAFSVDRKNGVTLTGLRLRGQETDPLGTAMVTPHVGLRSVRSTDVRVVDCDFMNWRGAGIAVSGSVSDDYYAYRVKVAGCAFHRCYFGLSAADRSEYSQVSDCSFSYCRLAIWNSSGNWTVSGNTVVACHGAYYSLARSSPYGTANGPGGDNWGHGSVTGNTFNHSNNGGSSGRWNTNAAFTVGGTSLDPGLGVVVDGVLPPTFAANTLWYTNVRANNLLGTRWLLSGCTFSNLDISCAGTVPVHLLGTQSRSATEVPRLSGNAKDLLPL